MFSKGILMVLTMTSLQAISQLKVHSNGTVSLGTSTSSGYTCTIAGYAGLKLVNGSAHLRFSPSTSECVIGTPSYKVTFWESGIHHQLNAAVFHVTSDSSLKTNILPFDSTSGINTVMQLNPVSYNYKTEVAQDGGNAKLEYGFLAQEVQQVLPDLVDSSMGVLVMNIDGLIPFLVMALQEQQVFIDSLTQRVTDLEEALYNGGIETKKAAVVTDENVELIELGQNNPNPFKESTAIPYNIPATSTSAQIIVYDLNGVQLKAYSISAFGEGELIIDGGTFKAGMYIYALIVDGQYIDSKKMILSK